MPLCVFVIQRNSEVWHIVCKYQNSFTISPQIIFYQPHLLFYQPLNRRINNVYLIIQASDKKISVLMT